MEYIQIFQQAWADILNNYKGLMGVSFLLLYSSGFLIIAKIVNFSNLAPALAAWAIPGFIYCWLLILIPIITIPMLLLVYLLKKLVFSLNQSKIKEV